MTGLTGCSRPVQVTRTRGYFATPDEHLSSLDDIRAVTVGQRVFLYGRESLNLGFFVMGGITKEESIAWALFNSTLTATLSRELQRQSNVPFLVDRVKHVHVRRQRSGSSKV